MYIGAAGRWGKGKPRLRVELRLLLALLVLAAPAAALPVGLGEVGLLQEARKLGEVGALELGRLQVGHLRGPRRRRKKRRRERWETRGNGSMVFGLGGPRDAWREAEHRAALSAARRGGGGEGRGQTTWSDILPRARNSSLKSI